MGCWNQVRQLCLLFAIGVAAGSILPLGAASAAERDERRDALWRSLAPFFQPPAELAGDLGDYRSPMLMDDGRAVRTPQEWAARRQEILQFWLKAIGPWPALIDRPQMEVLESEAREDLVQKKVRFPAAPGLEIEGYLLTPRAPSRGRRCSSSTTIRRRGWA